MEHHYAIAASPAPPPPELRALPGTGWLHGKLGVFISLGRTDNMRWMARLALVVIFVGGVFALLGRPVFELPFSTHPIVPVCPACGLTRGTIAALRGHVFLAMRYNPLSPLVPMLAIGFLIRWGSGLLTNRWLNVRYRPTRLAWILGAVAIATLWGYQMANMDFVLHGRIV